MHQTFLFQSVQSVFLGKFYNMRFFPLRSRCFIRKWVNPTFPDLKSISIYLSSIFVVSYTWIGVDRQGFGQVRPNVGAGS